MATHTCVKFRRRFIS